MIKRSLAAGAVALFLGFVASPAFAFHCPNDMAKIDAALAKNPKLSSADMGTVKRLRAEGETFHKAGNHKKAVKVLAEAMKMLGVK